MKKVEIISYYDFKDKKFDYDYEEIDIYVDGKLAECYGDDYHDKGYDKSDGFVDALNFIYGSKNIEVKRYNKNFLKNGDKPEYEG